MFVSDASSKHMVETYSSMGLVMALYVASIVFFCFPNVIDMSALIICIDLCELGGSRVVVRLPRPMEGNGAIPIFKSSQNCQFHNRRLESLEHFNVPHIYIILSITVFNFGPYGCHLFFTFTFLQVHFACVLCV